MDVVIDANVVFRILISQGNILDVFFNPNITLFAPERLREEFLRHKAEFILKSKLEEKEFEMASSIMLDRIVFVPLVEYKKYLPKAKALLQDHNKDEEFLALCLCKNCKFWTYESRFFKLGYAISTKELAEKLNQEDKFFP